MLLKRQTKPHILIISAFLATFCQGLTEITTDESQNAKVIYNSAINTLKDKYYLKSKIDFKRWQKKETNIKSSNDAYRYINELLGKLEDPYTKLLTQEEFKDEQNLINSSLVGIGIKLDIKKPVVKEILPNSPAHREGIEPNDLILAVGNKSTRGLRTSEVVGLIRGPKDSDLKLEIRRGKNILTKTLKREELKLISVSGKMLENSVALIKVESFIPDNTSRLFKEEILKLMSANGIIIDLRNNTGGLLKNATEIADMFLTEGKIVSTVTRLGKINNYANSDSSFDGQIIILTNENTASASEILASALKENNRATVIGKKTYGKGLIQEVIELPDHSALHVTVGAYLTPGGKNINKKGIVPDKIIKDEKEQLQAAQEILIAGKDNTEKEQLLTLSN